MRDSEPFPVAPPLVSLGQPVRFWVLTMMVPSASPELPPSASSGRRRSSLAFSPSGQRARPVSGRAREREPPTGHAREQATLVFWAVLVGVLRTRSWAPRG
jgi:hypothetical protein